MFAVTIRNVDNHGLTVVVFFSWFACGVIDAHADIRRISPVARSKTTGRSRIGSTEADAFSIAEFCQRHGISISMFYKMRAQDPKSVPREIHVGTRRLISKEAAADWRAERETATCPAKGPASAEVTAEAANRPNHGRDLPWR